MRAGGGNEVFNGTNSTLAIILYSYLPTISTLARPVWTAKRRYKPEVYQLFLNFCLGIIRRSRLSHTCNAALGERR
jgi:hypothetical protein